MSSFDDRLAALQEHVVVERKTPDEYLAIAERFVAEGNADLASFYLNMAKSWRILDRLDNDDEAEGWDDDDA